MTRMPGRTLLFSLLAVPTIALITGATPAYAQQPAPAPGDAAPVMAFPADGITLDDAIATTLRHDPAVQQSQVEIRRRQGLEQQFRGIFDTNLFLTAQYTHRTQEMSESSQDTERRKRDDLQEVIDGRAAFSDRLDDVEAILDLLAGGAASGNLADQIAPFSPATAATLRVLDALVAQAPPAQRAQFQTIRTDFIRDVQRGFRQEAADARTELAQLQAKRDAMGDAPIDEVFIDATGNLTVSKLYRSGITFAPFFDATFNGTNFKGKPRAAELGGKGISDVLQFRAGVNVTLPLLRGRGARSVAAAERAAGIDVEAAELILTHQQAASVLRTVQAYWNAKAAEEAVAVARQSIEFQAKLTNLTEQLMKAGDLAQVDVARAQGTEARARAQAEDAEKRYHEARVALADAMGVAVTGDPATLPTAADAFPASSPNGPVATLIEQAVGRRADLQAAARSIDAGHTLVEAARDDLRPRLDLQVGTWYTALGEGSGPKALDRWVGPSAGVGFQYEKPLGNNRAQGALVQREADVAQQQLAQRDLDRRIRLAVVESAGTLEQAAARVAQAEAAVGFYETTVTAELQRFGAGEATLLDTVITQQQQIDARLSLVLARQELAQRLAQLQFQTGALVTVPTVGARD